MFKWLKELLFDIPSQTFPPVPPVPLKKPGPLPELIKLAEYPTGKDLAPEDYIPEQPKTYPGRWKLGLMCHECGWVMPNTELHPKLCPFCGELRPKVHEVVYRMHHLANEHVRNEYAKRNHHMEVKK